MITLFEKMFGGIDVDEETKINTRIQKEKQRFGFKNEPLVAEAFSFGGQKKSFCNCRYS